MTGRPATSSGFCSVLFGDTPLPDLGSRSAPAFFGDLNLDQITEAATAGKTGYDLTPLFYAPLANADAIAYRHEVFRDLRDRAVAGQVEMFAAGMRGMREHLATARKLHHPLQRQRWFAEAVAVYCDAVTGLAAGLGTAGVRSRGLAGFRDYLAGYVRSEAFTVLAAETTRLAGDLSAVTYRLHIKGNRVRVSRYTGEDDYSQDVLATFERFRQGAAKDYRVRMPAHLDMNHVEAGILGLVAKLYPEVFAAQAGDCERHRGYLDASIARFDREIQFYLAYLGFIRPLEAAGLRFCYPQVSADSPEVRAWDTFDLALAGKLAAGGTSTVTNDFFLHEAERGHLTPGSVLLCNESFASTNEREGSQIARQIIQALQDAGIRIFFVTDLYDLAHGCYTAGGQASLFLRAGRKAGGGRTFRVTEGEPLPTSHGQDVYRAVFGAE